MYLDKVYVTFRLRLYILCIMFCQETLMISPEAHMLQPYTENLISALTLIDACAMWCYMASRARRR